MKNILIWVGAGLGIAVLGVVTYSITQKPLPLSSAISSTTASAVASTSTISLDIVGSLADNASQDNQIKALNATATKNDSNPPISPVVKEPITSEKKPVKASKEECANFASERIAKDVAEYPPAKFANYPS